VTSYIVAADEALKEIAAAIARGDVRERIGGPVKHVGFARLA
jgi:hypothetical protein